MNKLQTAIGFACVRYSNGHGCEILDLDTVAWDAVKSERLGFEADRIGDRPPGYGPVLRVTAVEVRGGVR